MPPLAKCQVCKDWGTTQEPSDEHPLIPCPKCKRLTWPNLGVNCPAGYAVALASSSVLMAVKAKARYVTGQKQHREHYCHWPDCTTQVPPAMWGCRKHWYTLPKHLRDRIWAAYQPGQEVTLTPSREYLAVAREVQEWISIHLRG